MRSWWKQSGKYRQLVFFFFQAEDGIRDYKVTGVQTCALPICRRERAAGGDAPAREARAEPVLRGKWRSGQRHRLPPRRRRGAEARGGRRAQVRRDRKSVVEGKRVDLGGRRII